MFQLFDSLKSLVKPQSCLTDNFVFRLNYKATVIILAAFSILGTARQYFGDPIDCMPIEDVPPQLLDTFCWIHSTFSVASAWHQRVGVDVPYPGVGKPKPVNEHYIYHSYYQWVCWVLFFQAIAFYFPRYIWKSREKNLVKNLICGLDQPILDKNDRSLSVNMLASYLAQNISLHNTLFYVHIFTEMLNFVNVIAQIYLVDSFLGGEFLQYGWNVLSFTDWGWSFQYDPMLRLFPRLAKCRFLYYGPTGNINDKDTLCTLPINILNEKIYIFLWFWLYAIAVANAIALVYRAVLIAIPHLRLGILTGFGGSGKFDASHRDAVKTVLHNMCIGDWFLLSLIEQNIQPTNFRDLIERLSRKFDEPIKKKATSGQNNNFNSKTYKTQQSNMF